MFVGIVIATYSRESIVDDFSFGSNSFQVFVPWDKPDVGDGHRHNKVFNRGIGNTEVDTGSASGQTDTIGVIIESGNFSGLRIGFEGSSGKRKVGHSVAFYFPLVFGHCESQFFKVSIGLCSTQQGFNFGTDCPLVVDAMGVPQSDFDISIGIGRYVFQVILRYVSFTAVFQKAE